MIQVYTENETTNFYTSMRKPNRMGGSAFVDGPDEQNVCLISTMFSVYRNNKSVTSSQISRTSYNPNQWDVLYL